MSPTRTLSSTSDSPLRAHLCRIGFALLAATVAGPAAAQSSFVNWENPHVSPLALTPDGTRLLAVNTADDRLEVFDATRATVLRLFDIPVGLDPVSVRARTNDEIWVVNHISDSVSIVSLSARNVLATLKTDDEPADVVFAGTPQRAFVTCSQANTVLVFDPLNLTAAPTRIAIDGEDPRALAVSADGSQVYAAIFESGNSSTELGGGAVTNLGFPPNVVSHPSGPYGGVNPPPNNGAVFNPPLAPGLPSPPKVGLIVKKNALGQWVDDNSQDWSALVSGANASLSGRPVGWDLVDNDIAIIDAANLSVTYARRLMNICMALAVHPTSGEVTLVGTDGTNEIRFEPIVSGKFLRVEFARVDPSGPTTTGIADLNPHLDYQNATLPQSERDKSLGDPRGIVWNGAGTRAYVTGMGSNNVIVIDSTGNRAGLAPTIEVGEGPTGIVIDEPRSRLYVLDKFEGAISVVSTASETEVARVPFHDPSPAALRDGRKHLYDTHKNSGLGQIACASCHVDARFDRLAWDLGNPAGAMKSTAGQNLGASIPGLNVGFQDWHPMKGPMTTQSLQDIIAKEPLHWRGDRAGLEEFNGAFIGLQGDDQNLTPQEMQEFENFLATVTYPPNPFRNFDNTLSTNLPLPGHFTTGRFGPAGQPLPNGNAVSGMASFRPPTLLDNNVLACVTCHTFPTGAGTDHRLQGGTFVPFPVGPNGEHHLMLVSQDGSTNVTIKVPQLRNLYEKVGFEATQLSNHSGFGLLHDGSVDSIARFVSEPVFTVTSDQQVANLVALMLSFSGSDLPQGSTNPAVGEPPGPPSKDTHAAVGRQSTLVSAANPDPGQLALLASMVSLADANKVGLVVKGTQAGIQRGYSYVNGSAFFQSDRAVEIKTVGQLQNAAALGSELTYTVVPNGSQIRIGIDRDLDGWFDRDELDAGTDPADRSSHPGGCTQYAPAQPTALIATGASASQINLTWTDNSNNEDGFKIERAPAGSGNWSTIVTTVANVTSYPDSGLACGSAFDYRIHAYNCAGPSGSAFATGATSACCQTPAAYCVAKLNSLGCTPSIGSTGSSSASAVSGFVITGSNVRNNKAGLLFYGVNGQASGPFQGGTLCVATPVKRTPGVGSGGNAPPANDCSGTYSLDMNAFASGNLGGSPLPALSIVGTVVDCQWWGRDPGFPAPNATTLTNALEYVVCQ
jgi:YVTN family beta-propeller protein